MRLFTEHTPDSVGIDNAQSSQTGNKIDIKEYQTIGFYLFAKSGSAWTIYVKASPIVNVDFTKEASIDNPWSYVNITNADTGAGINWSTGISVSWLTTNLYTVNQNTFASMAFELNYTSGSFSIIANTSTFN